MVTGGDTGTSENVLNKSENKSVATKRDKANADKKADEGGKYDAGGEPVNTLQEGELAEFLVGHVS